jgi:rRNA maturation RNase YbeY
MCLLLSFLEQQKGEINYIFCDDDYLHKLNVEYLDHDTLTDVISFDYTMGNEISGDCFISVERVEDNARILV